MKKIAKLMTLALAVITLASCEDVPSPFGTVTPPKTQGESSTVEPAGDGTAANPFNIAAAIAKCKEIGSTESTEKYYVKGVVVNAGAADATYGNASFYMADEEDTSSKFYAFQVLGSDGKKMTAGYAINVGDVVVIYGPIYNYKGNTPETAGKGAAYIVTINGKRTDEGSSTPTGEYGTKDAPLTVAKALEVINGLEPAGSVSPAYVKGKISKVQSFNDMYKSITYYISDDGSDTNALQVYSGKGLDGADFTAQTDLEVGWTVVVTGELKKYVNSSTGATTPEINQSSTIVSIDKTTGGNTTPDEGETKKVSVAEFLAASESTSDWYQLTGTVTHLEDGTYNNSTKYGNFDLVDETGSIYVYGVVTEKGGAKGQFADLMAAKGIKDGCKITIIGNRGSYKGAAQVVNAYFVSVEGGSGDNTGDNTGDDTSGGSSVTSLTNGDFETWADGLPTGWKSASSASSATLSQSTDAHGGAYSCNVNGNEGSNKRLASQEITLAAGSYTFSFWAKATSSDASQARPGYVPVTNGSVGSYAYGDYTTLTTSWQQISYDFTLGTETTVCLIVMNPKKSNYSSGKDILIDDATLTKK